MALAICVPVALGFATGHLTRTLPIAIGGLVSSVVDRGGTYRGRLRRIGAAVWFGGVPGLTVGVLIHGRGWVAVAVIVLLSLVSALMSAAGVLGAVAGLQMLVYAVLGVGPLGLIRPWWSVVLLFILGALWGTGLSLLGWLFSRRAPERHSVAEVYRAIARTLRAIGTEKFDEVRRHLVAADETAYAEICRARAVTEGTDPEDARLVALLGEARRIIAAVLTLAHEGRRPPEPVADWIEAVAEVIEEDGAPPPVPVPVLPRSPGADALAEALTAVRQTLTGEREWAPAVRTAGPAKTMRQRLSEFFAAVRNGRMVRQSAVRLTLCMGAAAILSETAPFKRSYWVMLTVTVVLQPDFGSVFARAVQRGIGTVVGAVIGAVILAGVPYGPLLVIPLAAFAFLAPYGISRNYGMFSTFLTPIVVLLVDLLTRSGWRLAESRLIDTLAGCAIVLVLGYAPWPSSWYAHVDDEFADAVEAVARYLETAFTPGAADRPDRYRQAYGRVSDLRTVFQRALAEPAAVRRRATAWYPAAVELDRLLDLITATSVTAERCGEAPDETAVRRMVAALDEIAQAVREGREPRVMDLPRDPVALPIVDAIRALQEQLRAHAPIRGSHADTLG